MYHVYCLISKKNSKFHYYGFTGDIEKRLKYHNAGKVRTTRRFFPVELLGYRTFKTKKEALKFEKDLKGKASYRKKFVRDLQEEKRGVLGSPA